MLLLCIGWCYSCKHGKRLKKKAKEYDEILKRLGSHAVALRLAHFSKKRKAGEIADEMEVHNFTLPDEEILEVDLTKLHQEEAKLQRRPTRVSAMLDDRQLF